jgi:hypothetical protein
MCPVGQARRAGSSRFADVEARHALPVLGDDRRRFGYQRRGRDDADEFLASLYLPGLTAARYPLARVWAAAPGRIRSGVPGPAAARHRRDGSGAVTGGLGVSGC